MQIDFFLFCQLHRIQIKCSCHAGKCKTVNQIFAVHVTGSAVRHGNIMHIVFRKHQSGDRCKRCDRTIFLRVIFVIKPDFDIAGGTGQLICAHFFAIQKVSHRYRQRKLGRSVRFSLIMNVRAVVFPEDASVCLLCIGFVAFFVYDIRQRCYVSQLCIRSRIFQTCGHGDFRRGSVGIRKHINAFFLVRFHTAFVPNGRRVSRCAG